MGFPLYLRGHIPQLFYLSEKLTDDNVTVSSLAKISPGSSILVSQGVHGDVLRFPSRIKPKIGYMYSLPSSLVSDEFGDNDSTSGGSVADGDDFGASEDEDIMAAWT